MDMKRRILILDENLSVPFDRRVWREATALVEAGYQVTVVSPRGRNFDRESQAVISDVHIYRFPSLEAGEGFLAYCLEYGWALIAMTWLTFRVFLGKGFDVIQICNPPDFLFLITLPYRLFGKTVIFDHHDLSPETYQSKFEGKSSALILRLLSFFERQTFRWADVVMSTNGSYKKVAIERGAKAPGDVIVVRNGPDLKRFRLVDSDPALKRGKPNLAYYVGTMGSQDGVDYLLRSVASLRKRREDFHVLIMGGGTELDFLKRYAFELDLGDFVTFTGRVSDEEMLVAMSTADVCVCPDPKNPLNDVSTMQKTLEYMALGKPVVAFDLIETRVSAGDAALYAEGNNEEDFAEKISTLFDSPELRERLGRIGYQRVLNGLSWDSSKIKLWEAYDLAFQKQKVR
jgi:glycosyltransferase involved in cell wall biosynthesis